MLTQSVHKVLHVQVERVNDASSRLIIVSSDVRSGQTTSYSVRLKHFDLDRWTKLLSQEIRS